LLHPRADPLRRLPRYPRRYGCRGQARGRGTAPAGRRSRIPAVRVRRGPPPDGRTRPVRKARAGAVRIVLSPKEAREYGSHVAPGRGIERAPSELQRFDVTPRRSPNVMAETPYGTSRTTAATSGWPPSG